MNVMDQTTELVEGLPFIALFIGMESAKHLKVIYTYHNPLGK
jgi:hypothetical protein